ncbi:hypothetical protein E4U38_008355 [Claviceps purpurea]|nr:hypothetical protein E4U38_008355 [Claviceps purpurea]
MCAAEKAAAEDSAALDSAFLEDPAVTAAKAHKLSYNPKEYYEAIITAAIELVVSDLQQRAASRQLLQFKADTIELMYETETSGDPDEFVISQRAKETASIALVTMKAPI